MQKLIESPNYLLLPPGDLRREHWIVRPVALQTARRMVKQYHYARGGSNTAVACFGLFHRERVFWDADCYGVTWWLPPIRAAAITVLPDDPDNVLALSRMVIHPGAPRNAATFLLARSVKLLPPRWRALVTYADTWRGHTGGVYRAANWTYVGETQPEPTFILNNRQISRKAGDRTYTLHEMEMRGAEMMGRYSKHKFVLYRPT